MERQDSGLLATGEVVGSGPSWSTDLPGTVPAHSHSPPPTLTAHSSAFLTQLSLWKTPYLVLKEKNWLEGIKKQELECRAWRTLKLRQKRGTTPPAPKPDL